MDMICRRLICLFLSVVLGIPGISAESEKYVYAVSKIPESVLQSAEAIVRTDERVFEIKDIDKATLTVKYAVTILKSSAKRHAYFVSAYDQFSKVKAIRGVVYDSRGEVVKKIKQEDINDYSANLLGGSLFQDQRIKAIDPEHDDYPFTVEYSYTLVQNGLFIYPRWLIYPGYDVAVESSSFTLIRPDSMEVRIHESDFSFAKEEKLVDGEKTTKWSVELLKPLNKEQLSPSIYERSPKILLAPSLFEIDGYPGNCSSWDELGDWINQLNAGKQELSEVTKQKIKSMLAGVDSDYEKTKVLYEYMQNKVRYVSIQIGIGGWQPVEASEVDAFSYGDCKALSNYMLAMLDVAGIKSYYTLIRAGRDNEPIYEDFPSSQFNHAILCVPIEEDTVWLECTSQRLPFGYLGSFTDDRNALVVNPNGGFLVKTESYGAEENKRVSRILVNLDESGDGSAIVVGEHQGLFYDNRLPVLLGDDHDRKKWVRKDVHIPNFTLEAYSIEEHRSRLPVITDTALFYLYGYGTKFGNRLAINLNLLNTVEKFPSKVEERSSDLVVLRSQQLIDSIVYRIPDGYQVEKISKGREVESKFGMMKTTVKVSENEVHFTRILKLNKGTYPAQAYGEFYEFYRAVKKGDDDRVILVASSFH